jgi:hypothetical protein
MSNGGRGGDGLHINALLYTLLAGRSADLMTAFSDFCTACKNHSWEDNNSRGYWTSFKLSPSIYGA